MVIINQLFHFLLFVIRCCCSFFVVLKSYIKYVGVFSPRYYLMDNRIEIYYIFYKIIAIKLQENQTSLNI